MEEKKMVKDEKTVMIELENFRKSSFHLALKELFEDKTIPVGTRWDIGELGLLVRTEGKKLVEMIEGIGEKYNFPKDSKEEPTGEHLKELEDLYKKKIQILKNPLQLTVCDLSGGAISTLLELGIIKR